MLSHGQKGVIAIAIRMTNRELDMQVRKSPAIQCSRTFRAVGKVVSRMSSEIMEVSMYCITNAAALMAQVVYRKQQALSSFR